ncbi:MAG: hypothetical protein HWE26_13705 [Alteromonadaceae bacterium]|nr:hypothetical protein [Alteromonadaceae bacterium]
MRFDTPVTLLQRVEVGRDAANHPNYEFRPAAQGLAFVDWGDPADGEARGGVATNAGAALVVRAAPAWKSVTGSDRIRTPFGEFEVVAALPPRGGRVRILVKWEIGGGA